MAVHAQGVQMGLTWAIFGSSLFLLFLLVM